MNGHWTFSLAAGTALLLGGALMATAAELQIGQIPSANQAFSGNTQVSTLVGSTVLDPQGQELGRIKDVLLDAQSGQATFVVIDAEIPASGHAILVVPYGALWVSSNPLDHRQSVMLDLRPDQVHSAAPDSKRPMADVAESDVSGTSPQLLSSQDVLHRGTSDREPDSAEPAARAPALPEHRGPGAHNAAGPIGFYNE